MISRIGQLVVPFAVVFCFVALLAAPASATECPSVTQNCTAKDNNVTESLVVPEGGDTCSGPNDTIEIRFTALTFSQGGGEKHDVAIWVPNDGLGLECEGALLDDTTSLGFSDLDGDSCGDIGGSDLVAFSAVYTIPCTDNNMDGKLDPFQIEASWVQPGGDIPNCVVPTVGPGTSAKCLAEIVEIDIDVPFCGDDILQEDLGEECDDGNQDSGDGCSALCEIEDKDPFCGDGIQDKGEACDDGNQDNTDDCLNACEAPSCGDDFLWDGNETCDDGNVFNTDDCLDTCEPATCGDGFVWDGQEECDGTPGCTKECTIEVVPSMTTWAYIVLALMLLSMGIMALYRFERVRE